MNENLYNVFTMLIQNSRKYIQNPFIKYRNIQFFLNHRLYYLPFVIEEKNFRYYDSLSRVLIVRKRYNNNKSGIIVTWKYNRKTSARDKSERVSEISISYEIFHRLRLRRWATLVAETRTSFPHLSFELNISRALFNGNSNAFSAGCLLRRLNGLENGKIERISKMGFRYTWLRV